MNCLWQQPVLVLGAGSSGVAAARLAAREGAIVSILDEAPYEKLAVTFQQMREEKIHCQAAWKKEEWTEEVALAIISPGIRPQSCLGRLAASLSCPVISELSFGARYCSCPLLAITGSNGKTTSIEMLTACLEAGGAKAIAGGNIGLPLSQLALQQEKWDYIAVEVSSFQLEYASDFHPDAAALLNITPDHLDRHGSVEAYSNLKLKLLQQCKEKGRVVVKAELLEQQKIAHALKNRTCISFSGESGKKAEYCCQQNSIGRCNNESFQPILDFSELPFAGKHNYENALCVLALLENLPIDHEKARDGLRNFHSGRHRLERVAEIDGVTYMNDSKATNVDALIKALEYCGDKKRKNIILLAGGVDKGCALEEAKSYLKMYVKQVLVIGQCRQRLAREWGDEIDVQECQNFDLAMSNAATSAQRGDIVLLSPGCASFDMFRDYAHRGQSFVEFVEKKKKES